MRRTAARRVVLAGGAGLAAMAAAGPLQAAGPSRFASYDSESDCLAAHTIAPAICRSAFANARAEYEDKTPSFATEALCRHRYAACMAWPPGTDPRHASFRPSWQGVDIVDAPNEHSVTPAPGSTGRAIRFASRPLLEPQRPLVIRGPAPGAPASPSARPPSTLPRQAEGAERPLPRSAPPPPGSGFKLEDGVLTYPAPARFQPRNLPKPN